MQLVEALIERLARGQTLQPEEWRQLERVTLQDEQKAAAFGIDRATVEQAIQTRSRLLQSVYPVLRQFCHARFHPFPLALVWDLWLPLSLQIANQRSILNRPFVQGVLGGQGTGKTTLCEALKLILSQLGCKALNLSLDDLYKLISIACICANKTLA